MHLVNIDPIAIKSASFERAHWALSKHTVDNEIEWATVEIAVAEVGNCVTPMKLLLVWIFFSHRFHRFIPVTSQLKIMWGWISTPYSFTEGETQVSCTKQIHARMNTSIILQLAGLHKHVLCQYSTCVLLQKIKNTYWYCTVPCKVSWYKLLFSTTTLYPLVPGTRRSQQSYFTVHILLKII